MGYEEKPINFGEHIRAFSNLLFSIVNIENNSSLNKELKPTAGRKMTQMEHQDSATI